MSDSSLDWRTEPKLPCQVIAVGYSAAALSAAIGGGLLDDLYYGSLADHRDYPRRAGCTGRFCFYADLDRVAKRLPVNERAGVLAARLGCVGELRSVPLSGDVLVTGATCTGDDTSVPDLVLSAARLGGLLPQAASNEPYPANGVQDLHDHGGIGGDAFTQLGSGGGRIRRRS